MRQTQDLWLNANMVSKILEQSYPYSHKIVL
jgi:hypothetical protein